MTDYRIGLGFGTGDIVIPPRPRNPIVYRKSSQRKRPTNTDFIQWLILRDYGETLTTERLERAYKEWQAYN